MSGEEASVPAVDAAPQVADEPQPEEAPAAEAAVAAAAEPAADGAGEQGGGGDGAAAADGDQEQPAGDAAKGEGEGKAAEGGEDRGLPNRPPQVFFNGAPAGVTQEDVEDLFGTYGKVARVELLLDYATKQTKGAGFVRYETVGAAADAVAALHGNYTFPGGSEPMTVRWAGGAAEGERKRKVEEEGPDDTDERQLFLAKVTRHTPEEAVAAVLGQYGQVEGLRMFKPTPDAVYHKGCGVVTFATKEECEYAMRMLDEVYVWEGMREPMVAKYNESEANKRRREDAIRAGPRYVSLEPPPPGCDIDALKLFVDNIPTAASVEDIRTVFKGFGRIIQILVARDRETGEPKGSAYIWFSRRKDADFAIRRLDGSTRAFSFVQPAAVVTAPEKPAAEEEEGAEKAEQADGEAEKAEREADKAEGEADKAEGEAEAEAAEGEAQEEKKEEEPAGEGPKPLVVKWAQSAVHAQRPGERPPAWMRQAAPPPFRGPPPMRGPPPGAWGPPRGAWGPPPAMGGWGHHGPPAGPPPMQPDRYGASYQGGYYQQQAAPPQQAAGGWGQQAPPQQAGGWGQQAPPQQAAGGWGQQAQPTQYAAQPTQYAAQPTQYAAQPTQYSAQPTQYAAQPTQYAAQPTQYAAQPTQAAPAAAPAAAAPAQAYDYSAYYQQQQPQQAAAAGGYGAPQQAYAAPAAAQPAAQPVGGYGSYPAQQQAAPQAAGWGQQAAPQQGGWGQQPAAGQQGYGY